MGGGVAGWLTPGWMLNEHRLAPHIAKPDVIAAKLREGEDPKPEVLDICKPQCVHWKSKLERCEM